MPIVVPPVGAATVAQSGAQSVTFDCPVFDESTCRLTIDDWNKLPAGKLKSFLTRQFASNAEFLSESAKVGLVATVLARATDGTPDGVWELGYAWAVATAPAADAGYVRFSGGGNDAGEIWADGSFDYTARISVSYSASE